MKKVDYKNFGYRAEKLHESEINNRHGVKKEGKTLSNLFSVVQRSISDKNLRIERSGSVNGQQAPADMINKRELEK